LSVIESVELVVVALAAGATLRNGESASAAVCDTYEGVKALTLRALRRTGPVSTAAVQALEADAIDEGEGRQELAAALAAVNAGADADLVAAARRLLELTDSVGAAAGKYQVAVRDAPDRRNVS